MRAPGQPAQFYGETIQLYIITCSKRNAAAGADGAVAKKKVKQVQDDAKLVGRVVAVPAWKFGAVWAGENYQKPRTAVLIGDITDVHPTRAHKPFNCAMRENEGYVIRLDRSEVLEFSLEGDAAALAKDTPCKGCPKKKH